MQIHHHKEKHSFFFFLASLVAQMIKNLPCNAGDQDSIPGLKDPLEKGMSTLPYPGLENPVDRGAWLAPAHGVARRWTRLSD